MGCTRVGRKAHELFVSATGGPALLRSDSRLASAVEPSTDHDVVIVGAGAVGLYAAYQLDNLGFDVLVLEATSRHGGRAYSSTLGTVGGYEEEAAFSARLDN